jgi:starch phosphorylase
MTASHASWGDLPNHFDLPRRIRRLADLAYNLWWTWHHEAVRLYRRLDPELWEEIDHNPVTFLRRVGQAKLRAATRDRYYLAAYDRVIRRFDEYMGSQGTAWFPKNHPEHLNHPVAYFSTQFGLHETLPIYAGGLGVLSGDHLKEASDQGMPMVAVGFLYTEGYFKQRITEDGWQEAEYASLEFEDLPVYPVHDEGGDRLTVSVGLAGREVAARLWRVQVGRVPLYMLDTNVESNRKEDRNLTARLYTSDLEMRIAQEIILGIGGVRALRALGYNPAAWHMNEGHSAFLTLERVRERVSAGHEFEQACASVRATTIFTTHTPVPAGHDEFPLWLMEKFFAGFWPQLGLDRDGFMDLARQQHPWGDVFSMSVLAIRMSEERNGVSELHGQVARRMWSHLWPDRPVAEVPISHITNGIHIQTWLARRLKNLFDRHFVEDWLERVDDPEIWEAIELLPDAELWAIRRHLKRKLVAYMRERARKHWLSGRLHDSQVLCGGVLLDPYALTIGFARRFATYKRATLILSQPERLRRLVNHPDRPVQVIFAGKAHPADEPGKRLIQEVYRAVKDDSFGGRLAFLEDYDVNLARYLVQGVDVWLNTPRRPKEASGTSGQKAAINGVLNFSVLDGWWQEGYNGHNGWAIGEDREWEDTRAQDEADVESLFDVLENQIIPLFYDRSADNLPGEWLGWMKESMRSLGPVFSMRRMVKAYTQDLYLPALPHYEVQ